MLIQANYFTIFDTSLVEMAIRRSEFTTEVVLKGPGLPHERTISIEDERKFVWEKLRAACVAHAEK